MSMRKHKLGLKHSSGTGKSRTRKAILMQEIKLFAKRNKLPLWKACGYYGICF